MFSIELVNETDDSGAVGLAAPSSVASWTRARSD
jgi:hypothetical protein